jgi:nodulation protein E
MPERRVVITGTGVITSIGHNTEQFWNSIIHCQSGIGPYEAVDSALIRFKNGAEVKNYNPTAYFDQKEQDLMDRFAQFALIAAKEAVKQSGMDCTIDNGTKTAVICGTSIGGVVSQEKTYTDLYRDNKTRVHPLSIPRTMPNSAASNISMHFGITGPVYTISTACASSNHAIGNAFWLIRSGICDRALAGGSETPFTFTFLKSWEAIRVVANDTCRPFSKNRQGMILGEGGGMLAMETLESAQERGATILAEIVGFGMSSDASHITKPDQLGAERAISLALEDGRVPAHEVDYINAHGTGTQVNDSMEIGAIKNIFGVYAKQLSVSSTKSLHGHILGGTSAVEAVVTVMAILNNILPPTANFQESDPECDLDIVPNASRSKKIRYALSNSFAFGGLNAVLAFKKWEGT